MTGSNGTPVNGSWEAEALAAQARTATARHRAATRDAKVRAVLRDELVAAKELLDEMERQHDASVAMLRQSAEAEVERVFAEARDSVAEHRAAINPGRTGANDGG